jgi:hypothetical protein
MAVIKTKFGKHVTLYNFLIIKRVNENKVKNMANTTEVAKEKSDKKDAARTYSKRIVKNRTDGGSITRSKTS